MTNERYFSICELSECAGSSTNVTMSTTAGRFVASRQRGAIQLTGIASDYIETLPFIDAPTATTFNMLMSYWFNNMQVGRNLIEWENNSGVVVMRLRVTSSAGAGVQLEYWNGATYTAIGTPFALSTDALYRFHFAIVCGASGSVAMHAGNILVASGSITSANMNHISKVRVRAPGAFVGETGSVSEWAAANFNLRDLTIRCDPPTANSATNTAWTGDYTSVDEMVMDDGDAISSSTAAQRESFTHAAYTLPQGMTIDSVWVTGRARANGAGPTDAKFMLRSGGIDYDSSALALGIAYEARARNWVKNPNGNVNWTQATYNAVEFGVVSI